MLSRHARALTLALLLMGNCASASVAHADWSWQDTYDAATEIFDSSVAAYVANIAQCESQNNPHAIGGGWWYDLKRGRIWQDFVGLMQIDPVTNYVYVRLVTDDNAYDALRDPRINLAVAALIQRDQSWRAWPICSR